MKYLKIVMALNFLVLTLNAYNHYDWDRDSFLTGNENFFQERNKITFTSIKLFSIKDLYQNFIEYENNYCKLSYQNIQYSFYHENGLGLYSRKYKIGGLSFAAAYHLFHEKINRTSVHENIPALFISFEKNNVRIKTHYRKQEKGLSLTFHQNKNCLSLNIKKIKKGKELFDNSLFLCYQVDKNLIISFKYHFQKSELTSFLHFIIKKTKLIIGVKEHPILRSTYFISLEHTL